MNKPVLPKATIESVLHSPTTSQWLHHALESALTRDPIDAASDAEVLADILADRAMAALLRLTKKFDA